MNGAAPRPRILQGRETAPAVPPWLTHALRPLIASALRARRRSSSDCPISASSGSPT